VVSAVNVGAGLKLTWVVFGGCDIIGKRLNIHGFWMYFAEYLPKIRAALTAATNVVASGKLTLPISATYKPPQIKEAIEHAERTGIGVRSLRLAACHNAKRKSEFIARRFR
jgi:hypothetical protein